MSVQNLLMNEIRASVDAYIKTGLHGVSEPRLDFRMSSDAKREKLPKWTGHFPRDCLRSFMISCG